MKNKFLVFLELILILFSFTGCYDASSIENYIYGTGLGIDINEDNTLNLSLQILSIEGSNNFTSKLLKPEIINVTCNTINSGLNTINNYISKPLNLSHCEVIIFSETAARKGIGDEINTLANNLDIRPNSNIIISKNPPQEILKLVTSHSEGYSTRFYKSIIDSWKETGFSTNSYFSNFFASMNSEIPFNYASYAEIINNTVQIQGLSVFNRDKLVGVLNSIETLPFLLFTNKLEKSTISIDDPFNPEKKIDIDISLYKDTKNKVSLSSEHIPYISSDISLNGSITSGSLDFDYSNKENIAKIENSVNNYISELCVSSFNKLSKEYNSDISKFYQYLSYKYLTKQDLEKVNWVNVFKDSVFTVNCSCEILSSYLFLKQ